MPFFFLTKFSLKFRYLVLRYFVGKIRGTRQIGEYGWTSGRLCACNNASHAASVTATQHSRRKLRALRAHEWERVPDIAKRGEMATRYTDCTRHISGSVSLCTTARDYMYITAAPSSRTRVSLCCLHLPLSPSLSLSLSLLSLSLTYFIFLFPERHSPPDCRRTAKTDETCFEL